MYKEGSEEKKKTRGGGGKKVGEKKEAVKKGIKFHSRRKLRKSLKSMQKNIKKRGSD